MIFITKNIAIAESEIQLQFIRAQGPGGQNVNKVASAVQLRFNVMESRSLPADVRLRLKKLAGKQMTHAGELIITAQRFRSQERNREDAIERLIALIRRALIKPKRRIKTKPTAASKQKRLEQKKHRGNIKRLRRKGID